MKNKISMDFPPLLPVPDLNVTGPAIPESPRSASAIATSIEEKLTENPPDSPGAWQPDGWHLRVNDGARLSRNRHTESIPCHLVLAPQTVLLTPDVVCAKYACSVRNVKSMVEKRKFRWVWDLSVDGRIRYIRFWVRELVAPHDAARLNSTQVIAAVLGPVRATIPRAEIERGWIISPQHIIRLIEVGEFEPVRIREITYASVAAFLTRRLK